MFGPRRPQKTYAYYRQTVPTGSDIDRGSSSTLGVVSTFGGIWPGLGRRHGRKDLRLEGGRQHHARAIIAKVSARVPARADTSTGRSVEDISPAHGLGSVTLGLVPLADDLAKLQPPPLHLLGLGSHLLLGRRSLFLSQLRLCPR
jgi:hypothetical protein